MNLYSDICLLVQIVHFVAHPLKFSPPSQSLYQFAEVEEPKVYAQMLQGP